MPEDHLVNWIKLEHSDSLSTVDNLYYFFYILYIIVKDKNTSTL